MDILDTPMGFQPSESTPPLRRSSLLQEAIYSLIQRTEDNLLINAGAGCGKSTTLVGAMDFTGSISNLFLAFNKSIADEMRIKVGGRGVVKTLNALGMGCFYRYRRVEVDDRRVLGFLKVLLGEGEDYRNFAYTLKRVVGLMKNQGMGLHEPVDHQQVIELIDSYQMDIPFDRLAELALKALEAFKMSIRPSDTIDYDDQLYIPLLENWEYPFYSNVFVDECQDLSPIQHMMLDKMATRGSRIIAVGDPFQAIYGFRGALTNSIQLLKDKFQMKELPLSISYRCAQAIVRSANEQCPTLQAREGAPEGIVQSRKDPHGGYEEDESVYTEDPKLFDPGLLVLSRNNAPLFRAILRHIRAKSPCRILSNFLESFEGFLRSFKVSSTSDLIPKLDQWFANEKEAALKKGFRGKVAGLMDKYETSVLLAREFKTVDEIVFTLKRLSTCSTGPTFSTIHKAKGLEAHSVYILRPDTLPSPFATTPDAIQQERNLLYVAKTRAIHTLTFGISPEF